MYVSSVGFKSIIGRKIISDIGVELASSQSICCIKPDQFGRGLALQTIHPECHSKSEHTSGGKVCGNSR